MQRLERLFAINETLRRASPRRVSAARLAEEFGVTRRTIERDLAALNAAGVPLYAERGRTGGHISLDQIGNVVVTLTPTEVTALLIAVTAAGPDMPYADAGTAATKRLLDGLPTTTRVGVEQLRNRIRARRTSADRAHKRIRRTIETAVERGLVASITYRDEKGVETQRRVDALGFYQGATSWFLIGWCHLRRSPRIFKLDRIAKASLTKTPVEQRDLDEALGWIPGEVTQP